MKLTLLSFLFLFILSVSLISAPMSDVKTVVCNDVNLTEPNCTTWWNTLNLTEANFTINNITNYTTMNYTNNITLVYEDNRNQTVNNTVVHSNFSTTKNNTYISYNYTGNLSDLNLSKDYILSSEVDTKISSAISPYVLKSELPTITTNSTELDELKDNLGYWKWSFIIVVILIIIMLMALLFRGGGE